MMIEDMSFNQTARLEIQTPIGIPTTHMKRETYEEIQLVSKILIIIYVVAMSQFKRPSHFLTHHFILNIIYFSISTITSFG